MVRSRRVVHRVEQGVAEIGLTVRQSDRLTVQRKPMGATNMVRMIVKLLAWVSLVVVIGAPVYFLIGKTTLPATQWWMLLATIGWFVCAGLDAWRGNAQ